VGKIQAEALVECETRLGLPWLDWAP
jgi:hypothetical protein